MPLASGACLGPYEILNPIGAGGMGEVYKARDTRLNRLVAIKLSKEAFSERFEREARSVAALNHPNICQLYDVGPNYLVMEFVEGSPVASVDTTRKLLDIAVQIADGLSAAHAAGIIHRDLKPDNILITRDGRVKILDFGLAKTVAEGAAANADATRTVAITEAGSTIGTIAYMSPEQARGTADLTQQSDQFSLGLVLYELAAGKRAFRRDSAAETMTAIIREEAEPLPDALPAQFRWVVERLLAKEPAERYDSTRDLYRELRQVRDRLSQTGAVTAVHAASTERVPRAQRKSASGVPPAAFVVAVLAAVWGWMANPGGIENYRFTPMEVSWENPSLGIWSPDGKAFAYRAGPGGGHRLFVRYLNSPTATPLTKGAVVWYPAGWSPDGKRVIATSLNPQGATPPFALFSVPVFGGEPELIMPIDTLFSRVSPDGKALVAVRIEKDGKLSVYTASPVGSALKRYSPAPFEVSTISNGPYAVFSPDSRSIVLILDALGARQAWDLPYPAGQGEPRRILQGLSTLGNTPRWSPFPDGRNGVVALTNDLGLHLWFGGLHSGPRHPVTAGPSSDGQSNPSISPDGRKILFVKTASDYVIASASLADASVERLVSSELVVGMPSWARHQNVFVYESRRSGPPAIWMRSEGSDRPLVTPDSFPPGTTNGFSTPELSPGGDRLTYTRSDRSQHWENWISSVSGGPAVRLTNTSGVVERGGSWSPDGGRIAYWQFLGDTASLMVVKTTGEATPTRLRDKIDNPLPEWSPDGQWISFRDASSDGLGWSVISPDGKTVRSVGEPKAVQMTFSADSRRLIGIRVDGDHRTLLTIDIATKEEKTIGDIGKEFTPLSYSNPGVRLSLSPDGKSILFPTFHDRNSLWMLEGVEQPGWLDRFRDMLGF